jgi:glycosyltransferase involved in cell wall biosynthesis
LKKVLIFSPTPSGGLAEHVYYQARALQRSGLEVCCLATKSFLPGRRLEFGIRRALLEMPPAGLAKIVRRPWQVLSLVANQWLLALWILLTRPDFVLLETYSEYLSPLWVWPHWCLKSVLGVRYVANLHDPVRKALLGPSWWHSWSFLLAYKPIGLVLVHGKLTPEAKVPVRVRSVEVPVGVYDIPSSKLSREEVRAAWGAKENHKVFLSFGFVRDGKNLDLAIRALKEVPEAFLVIAGQVAASSDRPFSYYHDLSANLGVSDRCCLKEGFVPDDELGGMFAGTDFVLLTYSGSFHSQSGVLNIAARAQKPVLASSAPGPLVDSVRRFKLGVVVEPDSAPAVIRGLLELIAWKRTPSWAEYEQYAGWDTNASRLLNAVDELADVRHPGSTPIHPGPTQDTGYWQSESKLLKKNP